MITFLFGLCIIGLSLYLYLTWNFNYWDHRGIAGPRPRPYVGTFPKTALLDKNSNYISETSEIFRLVKFSISYRLKFRLEIPLSNQIKKELT